MYFCVYFPLIIEIIDASIKSIFHNNWKPFGLNSEYCILNHGIFLCKATMKTSLTIFMSLLLHKINLFYPYELNGGTGCTVNLNTAWHHINSIDNAIIHI